MIVWKLRLTAEKSFQEDQFIWRERKREDGGGEISITLTAINS